MKLHLNNGEVVDIFRRTVSYYFFRENGQHICNGNIDPIQLLQENKKGYFAVGEPGCEGYFENGIYYHTPDKFEKMIPIINVSYISEIDKW